MKAAVCRAFGAELTIEEFDIAPPGPGQIAVRTAACAICHSDVALMDGVWGGSLPAVYGHEAAGTVQAVGPGVTGFAVGDPVLVTLIHSCGACPACARGAPTSCDAAYEDLPSPLTQSGAPITQGLKTAGFAEEMVVGQSQCVRLPDDLALDVASLLACGVITGVGAVTNTADLQAGQSALVIGAGGVGLNTVQGCALRGASPLIAVDLFEEKLEAARDFGAEHCLTAEEASSEAVRALNGGRGVDFVFVTAQAVKVFEAAPDYLAPGGAMIMVGMPGLEDKVLYSPVNFSALNQSIRGSRMGQTLLERDIPWLIDRYRAGALKLDELISRRYPLEDINLAIKDMRAGHARRNVIVFDEGAL